ncbi:hypothetical protein [Chondromyces crocatus]|uniref:Uncharacterized protein n=1 Tax=Chondromyces crocatus TaxID=52 RepID=A0A0K1EFN5_CHOCO|nr:hypothetical protein [Chondromyces crocatus]AKT39398.1 uncharacterized protein CMC5_035450 [Chondromyces crocatus]
MPAFVAPLIGFALGALLAWIRGAAPLQPFARSQPGGTAWQALRDHGVSGMGTARTAEARSLALATLFGLLVFTPICAYFLTFAPDWSFAYLIDSRRVPSALELLLLIADAAAVPAGFLAMERAGEHRSFRATGSLVGAPLALAALLVLLLGKRLTVEGTYRQIQGDFGVGAVAGGPLGYALLWMHGLLIAGLVLTAQALLNGRRSAKRPPREGDAPRRPAGPAASAPRNADPTRSGRPMMSGHAGGRATSSGSGRLLGNPPARRPRQGRDH